MILPPPADLEAFHRGEPVKVRVRMEPQPAHRFGRVYDYSCERGMIRGNMRAINKLNPLGPPGTRHGVRAHVRPYEVAGMIFPAASMYYGCATVTPEPPERDENGWWWVATVRKETA